MRRPGHVSSANSPEEVRVGVPGDHPPRHVSVAACERREVRQMRRKHVWLVRGMVAHHDNTPCGPRGHTEQDRLCTTAAGHADDLVQG